AIRQDAILRDDHNPVANVIYWAVELLDAGLVQETHVGPNVRVLVDVRVPDHRSRADTDIRDSRRPIEILVLFIFVVIGAHHQRSVQIDVFANKAAYAHD